MRLAWYQRLILNYLFPIDDFLDIQFDTVLWSEPKKSGKSSLAAAVMLR